MPTYEFYCQHCDTIQDVVLSIGDRDKPQRCACLTKMVRQVTTPAFKFHDTTFSSENKGKGRYFGQLAEKQPLGRNDPKAYFKTQEAADAAAQKHAEKHNKHFERIT